MSIHLLGVKKTTTKLAGLLVFILMVLPLSAVALESVKFPDTKKNRLLFEKAVELKDKIEREHGRYIISNGVRLFVYDFGPKDGTPLIWCHAVLGSGAAFFPMAQKLAKEGYRVIAPDLRAHGNSQVSDYNFTIYDMAEDIKGVMSYLNIDKAVLSGLLQGGAIAAAFYDLYPESTMGLLFDAGGSFNFKRWNSDIENGVIEPGPRPQYSVEASKKIFGRSAGFNRFEATQLMIDTDWYLIPEPIDSVEALLYGWLVNVAKLPSGKWGPMVLFGHPLATTNFEKKMPEEIFKNLMVPMHIIDPVADGNLFQVSHQNEKLQKLHPDLITHEIYEDTELTGLARPERFVKSAKALLDKINTMESE